MIARISVCENSALDGIPLKEIRNKTEVKFLVAYIEQDGETSLPSGDTVITHEKTLGVLLEKENIPAVLELCGSKQKEIKKIALIGAGRIGTIIAEKLIKPSKHGLFGKILSNNSRGQEFVIIDNDDERTQTASEKFPEARVLRADASDESFLNEEGITSACEGDVPALLSMAVLGELSGKPVFQANPSQIFTDTNEIIFAHCTLPLNMVKDFEIMTHFESQIGVAFRGKLAEGPITVFKTDGLIQEYFVSGGILEENLTKYNLCRTQVKLKLDNPVFYFLQESIGNHHIIVEGDYVDLINEFYRWY